MMREPSPEERRSKAIEARQFKESPLFQAMFDGVSDSLENRALACPSTDKEMAADIIRCKQLLVAMKREVERRIEDGDFASFEIEQLARKGVIRRFIR